MIISASRRTDIPAFHMEWMMNRLRAGYCLVRNPMVANVVYRIDLDPKNVDAIIFVSKNPAPVIPYLKEIASMGHLALFQVTITPYGRDMEPGVPFKADVADAFKEISDRLGADRMIWRYDPIILNDRYDLDFHRRKFELLCRELEGYTHRCTFSFLEMYGKLQKHRDVLRSVTHQEMDAMAEMMVPIAERYGMSLSYCCSKYDLSRWGIEPRGCIDRQYMRKLGIPFEELNSPLREGCRCVKNIDIGSYDTCGHDCLYCYANRSDGSERSQKMYDPEGEMLYGKLEEGDTVVPLLGRDLPRLEDYFDYTQYGNVARMMR
jgi:DNA repair photolyase